MYIDERKERVLQKVPAATGEWCPHRNIETVRGVRSNDLNRSGAERRGDFEDTLHPIFVGVAGGDWHLALGLNAPESKVDASFDGVPRIWHDEYLRCIKRAGFQGAGCWATTEFPRPKESRLRVLPNARIHVVWGGSWVF